jgi:hypothetical protein
MQIRAIRKEDVLRPSRLNAAGWCIWCLGQHCDKPRCIASHAATTWQICERCGGTEYVNGHRDPENAAGRCDCIQGFEEVEYAGAVAEVVPLSPALPVDKTTPVVYESWPAGGGAPIRWAR